MTVTSLPQQTAHDPEWTDRALCRYDAYPDLWHPDGTTSQVQACIAEAKRICNLCPVRRTCLEQAMEREGSRAPGSRYGIQGGLDEDERFRLYRRRASREAAA